ncbi:VCBS repeat-containing protein [candidate division KSB1 bacterium]|nr:VCBS repeat-containing protein [candidate division KSB1 bacterium]
MNALFFSRLLLLFALLFSPLSLYAQTPLYSDPLDDASAPALGTLVNRNGQFIAGQGWKATSTSSQLMITLPQNLPGEGVFIVDVTNFDPVSQNADVKQQIINLYSQANGSKDVFYSGGSWFNIRTGTGYTTGPGVAGFKFLASPNGIDARGEQRCLESSTWNLNQTYEFRVAWNSRDISVYVDGERQSTLGFAGQNEPFRYIFLGTDNVYQGQAGPIYSNLRIYGSGDTPPPPPTGDVYFTDISAAAGVNGYSAQGYGHTVSFTDIDGDGRSELMIGNATVDALVPMQLYWNEGNQLFDEQAALRGVDQPGMITAMVNADFDLDGDFDLFQANMLYTGLGFMGPNRLFINNGSGYYREHESSGLTAQGNNTRGAVAFDADGDGDLDLYCVNWGQANELYLNDGQGRFTRVFQGAEGSDHPEDYGQLGVTAADIDNDGDIDLYVCRRPADNQRAENFLFINDGTSRFTEEAVARGVNYPGRSHGAVFADVDNDGDLDLFVINYAEPDGELPLLGVFINDGDGYFSDRTNTFNIRVSGYHLLFADVDNDTDLDLYLIRNADKEPGARAELYLNDGSGGFTKQNDTGLEVGSQDARGAAAADIDGDGDVDFVVAFRQGTPVLLRNDSETDNHYLQFLARGPRGDYGGIGSKVTIYKAGHLGDANNILGHQQVVSNFGYLSQSDPVLHFGLGEHGRCDVRVIRTDGSIVDYSSVAAGQLLEMPVEPTLSLERYQGDNQSAAIFSELAEPLVIRLRDAQQQPAAGIEVTFSLLEGEGEFFPSSRVTTNNLGLAEVRFRFGRQIGQHRLQATVAGVSPVEFTATALMAPPTATLLGDGQSGRAGRELSQPVGVRLTDVMNNPIADYPVRFLALGSSGVVDGANTVEKVTDNDGIAIALWTVGTGVGTDTLLIIGDFVATDTLMATASVTAGPAARLHSLVASPADPIAPGYTFRDPFAVRVVDEFGNAVSGHSVRFTVIEGGGNLEGREMREMFSDNQGEAGVIWTLGPVRGPKQVLSAFAEINGTPLEDSPVTWVVVPRRLPDPQRSTLTATSPIPADGLSASRLEVVLLDSTGFDVGSGFRVQFEISGTDNRVVFVDSLSDADGRITAFLSSTASEVKQVRVRVMGLNLVLDTTVWVEFQPSQIIPASFQSISGNNQVGTVGKELAEPFVVQVLGRGGDPMADHPVVFRVGSEQGRIGGEQNVSLMTDADGMARVLLTLGTRAGQRNHWVQAMAANAHDTLLFVVSALPDVPERLFAVSGDSQQVAVNSELPLPLIVQVWDRYENPCPQELVTFTALDDGRILTPQPVSSDSLGRAECRIAVGEQDKQYVYEARLDGGAWHQFFAFARNQANQPPIILSFLPTDTLVQANAGDRIDFWLQIVDADGDSLSTVWLINDVPSGEGSAFTLLAYETLPSPTRIVACVSDGQDNVSREWIVHVQSVSVELSAFYGRPRADGTVELRWRVASASQLVGFWVARSESPDVEFQRLHEGPLVTENGQSDYCFVDQTGFSSDGTVYYRLEALDRNGSLQIFGPIAAAGAMPSELVLHPNYPNPFNPTTTLRFSVPERSTVSLRIFSVRGVQVRTLISGRLEPGNHSVLWDAHDDAGMPVPSGLYCAVLDNDRHRQIIKVTLLK